jgi:hypothetical protein
MSLQSYVPESIRVGCCCRRSKCCIAIPSSLLSEVFFSAELFDGKIESATTQDPGQGLWVAAFSALVLVA